MIVLLIVALLAAVSYWVAAALRRREARSCDHVPPPPTEPIPLDLSQRGKVSMTWTSVDDRQFRRLTDGMSPDHGG